MARYDFLKASRVMLSNGLHKMNISPKVQAHAPYFLVNLRTRSDAISAHSLIMLRLNNNLVLEIPR